MQEKISWDEIKFLPYDKIKELMLNEDLKVLCSNCHAKKQSIIYYKFKDFVYAQRFARDMLDKIYASVDKEIERLGVRQKKVKLKVKAWINKRYIIEKLYNGRCVSCGILCNKNNLPIFIFHYRSIRKIKRWGNMKSKDIKEIIEWLKNDECICLCANCYALLHSKLFIKYSDLILKNIKQKLELIEEIKKMKKKINDFGYQEFLNLEPN